MDAINTCLFLFCVIVIVVAVAVFCFCCCGWFYCIVLFGGGGDLKPVFLGGGGGLLSELKSIMGSRETEICRRG